MFGLYKVKETNLHLWYIPLNVSVDLSLLFTVLSGDEQQRANNFHFERLKKNYVLRRYAFRHILSLYCNAEPKDLSFGYNNYQKPYLLHNTLELQFNMSDSHEMAILAITKKYCVGVDIEHVKPIDNFVAIAKQFFSKAEFNVCR